MAKFVCVINNGATLIGQVFNIFGTGSSAPAATLFAWNIPNLTFGNATNFPVTSLTESGGNYTIEFDAPSGLDLSDISLNYPTSFTTNSGTRYGIRYDDATPIDLTICDECRNITLQACADSYKIVAGLTPATNYFVTIQDRNNDLYIQEITSDGNGDVTIDATSPEFPAGFWLTESGNKVIRIYADASLEQPEDITVDTTVYSCVLLNLQYYYTTTT